MKYFIPIIFYLSAFCCAQDSYYLLPNENSFNLYERIENELVEIDKLEFNYTDLYAFDKEELVIVNNDSTKFHYGRIKNSKFEEEIVNEFPEKFSINTIELKDGFVYLGGSWSDGELFYVFDLKSKEFYPVPIPDEAFKIGKAIDDILFLDDKIIAVDNIREPKFLIDYNSGELPELTSSKTFSLESNGTYEHIYKGDINENYLILLSETVSGYIGFSNHISVLISSDYNQGFSIDSRKNPEFNSPTVHWVDILLRGDTLLIACKEKGIGVLEIKNKYFKKSKHKHLKDVWHNNIVNQNKINYRIQFENEPIKLLPFNSEKIIVILNDSQNQKSFQLIEI